MPAEHFMRDDLIGVVLGTVLYAPFLLAPGFVFGWFGNLLGFRGHSRGLQALISLVLSVSVAPIVAFLIGTFLSNTAVWIFYGLATALAVAILIARRHAAPPTVIPKWAIWTALGWALVVWVSGIDLQIGNRLYPSVLAYDFNLRTAMVEGLSRNGLPAMSPLFYPGHLVPLRYHYFWFIAATLVHQLGGPLIGARQALIASDVWCGFALMATVALFLRFFHPAGERAFVKRAKWGIGMLVVAGLDIFPNIFLDVANHLTGQWFVFSSAEWWNTPVTAFPHAVFFEAHHVASTLACFAGFLLLWRSTDALRTHWPSVICAGLSLASAVGLSVYVGFTFAIFLIVWTGFLVLTGKWLRAVAWVAAGAIALACALAFVHAVQQAGGSGGSFLSLTVRSFYPFDVILPAFGFTWNQIALANFLALPLNYFLETGVWLMLAVLWWSRAIRRRKGKMSPAGKAALVMFTVSILVGTFLRSGVINNNDLGWRSVLIAQLILAVWAADPMRAWWRVRSSRWLRRKKPTFPALKQWQFRVAVLIVCGFASTLFDFAWMRIYIPFSDTGAVATADWFTKDHQQGTRTFAVRQAYEQLNRSLPKEFVLQANPNHWNDVYHGLYGLHQTASFDYTCGSVMGGDPVACETMQAQLIPMFNDPTRSKEFNIDRVCDAWGIHVLIAKDNDAIFRDRSTWPWTRPALFENENVRAVSCGEADSGTPRSESAAKLPILK